MSWNQTIRCYYDNDACKLSNKSGSIFASASKMICTSTPCNIPNSSTFYNSSPPSLQLPASLLVAAPSLSSRLLNPTLLTLFTCHLQFSSSPTLHLEFWISSILILKILILFTSTMRHPNHHLFIRLSNLKSQSDTTRLRLIFQVQIGIRLTTPLRYSFLSLFFWQPDLIGSALDIFRWPVWLYVALANKPVPCA